MRLDKYLKVARIIKRRTIAREACDKGLVVINGKTAKAGSEVAVGDRLTLAISQPPLEVEVLQVTEHVKKEEADSLYRLIKE
ncbi:RNA-binding S4 domain-containing protein [Anoxynatronum sibiricum]|uniref:RQC P-site tRNA stabilizing factor n=1 Tax=Anoxynatronum sibiricum TaxID=210623 RepID=A0ABU9VVI3_9CLOT